MEKLKNKIFTIENKKEEKFLRQKAIDLDFPKFSKKELNELIQKMKNIMIEANGVGLSANQIGLSLKFFVAQIPKGYEGNMDNKFYAIFNPEIFKYSNEEIEIEEACLSVPNLYGMVKRAKKITVVGHDKNGKKLKIKAWGLLAIIFQHEIDHLNGILFIDKAKDIQKIDSKNLESL